MVTGQIRINTKIVHVQYEKVNKKKNSGIGPSLKAK